MKVTINAFGKFLSDANGVKAAAPGDNRSSETLTADGESSAIGEGAIGVHVSTDTAITGDFYGSGTSHLMHAGSEGFFPATPGQTFTIAEEV